MIFLYILLSIIFLVLVVLIINLRVTVKYGNKSCVKLGALFLDFDFPFKKKETSVDSDNVNESDDETIPTVATEKTEKNKNIFSELTEGLEISDFILLLQKLIGRMVESSSGHVKVRIKKLEVTVADKQPSTAAILYGSINAAVAWLIEYLSLNTKLYPLNKSSIFVNCDFDKDKTEAEIEIVAKIRIIHLIKFILKFFFDFIKFKESKNQTSLKGTK